MTIETAHKIQIAADMIHDEMYRRGTVISPADCLVLARRLHDIWENRIQPRGDWPLGMVARQLRERYEESGDA